MRLVSRIIHSLKHLRNQLLAQTASLSPHRLRHQRIFSSAPQKYFRFLTLLAQDYVCGLQVQTPNGYWVDVPPLEGAFVVNVGDMLHRLSNGKLLSTPHRVINTTGRERYSVPFFFDPHVSTMIAPLPGTGRPKFEPLNFGSFLKSELEASYDAHPGASIVV